MSNLKLNTALNLWSAVTCGFGVLMSILMLPASVMVGLICAAVSAALGWWFFSTYKKRYLEGHKPEVVHHVIGGVLFLINGLVTLAALVHNIMLLSKKD